MMFVQYYFAALTAVDVYDLCHLWVPALVLSASSTSASSSSSSAAASSPLTALLSNTLWFDTEADALGTAALYSVCLFFLVVPRLFVLYEPLNRWLLLSAAVAESLRLVLFSFLFSVNEQATSLNTMHLTLLFVSAGITWRLWYMTMCRLREAALGSRQKQ